MFNAGLQRGKGGRQRGGYGGGGRLGVRGGGEITPTLPGVSQTEVDE